MKIIFFGTPDYVIPVLAEIKKLYDKPGKESVIACVVTQPPMPVGRDRFIQRSAIDNWAFKRGIKVIYDFKDEELPKADLGILAAYGKIIPESVIKHFPLGIINIHPSLLPKYRGASPIQAAIAMQESETGVTFIKLDSKMDHGSIVTQFRDQVEAGDTCGSLRARLFERSAKVLKTLLPSYLSGKVKLKPQDHGKATFTTLLKKEHGFIEKEYLISALEGKGTKASWNLGFVKDVMVTPTPKAILAFINAMNPWPNAWTKVTIRNEVKRLKIISASLDPTGKLSLNEVQIEGKSITSWKQVKEAYPEIFS